MELSPHIPSEMRIRYLSRRKTDLASLEDALSRQDGEVFKKVGHQLKGNAATFSYHDLEAIGIELEKAGRAADFYEARRAMESLRNWIAVNDSGSH